MAEGRFVAYYRVSTEGQGRSGLGLEAQREAVRAYLDGGRWSLLAGYTEVETGKGKNALDKRPQLQAALALCRKRKATLVIAKLDRLARNVHFVSGLMESKVPFVAVDLPSASPFMLHVYAAVAEEEARKISERTRAALAAAKARGVRLGRFGHVLAKRNRAEAGRFAKRLSGTLQILQAEGFTTVRAIADELTRRGVPTPRGGKWQRTTVHRLLQRIGKGD